MPGYAYMLRYTLEPGHLEDQRLNDLTDFCRSAGINDVMFIIAPLNLRHITSAEVQPWLETIGRAKSKLEPHGVTASINPLNSLTHADAANTLLPNQHFQLMMDPRGKSSSVAVCPLCPEWRQYIKEIYTLYASVFPDTLWVEDDFRFHNHDPLVWGGCFCESHMREFARQAGVQALEREAFVQGLLAAGEPHPYRRIWLDTCRRTMVELAGEIAGAVHRVSPDTRIGLMTSSPIVHAAEGRDWHGIVQAFSGRRPAIVRTHLPAYRETSGMLYAWNFHEVSSLTNTFLPAETETYPELENIPYSSFAKSKAFQRYQLETSLVLGSRGITLNIMDMVGNGVYPEEGADTMLSEEKPFMQAVSALELDIRQLAGVEVIVNEKSSYSLHTNGKSNMEALYPRETFWSSLLSAFGVANRYAVVLPRDPGVIALSGQSLRRYTESEIRSLFANHAVLLDGEAAHTLYELGLGSLCGITHAEWRSVQTFEQITNGLTYAGISKGRMRPNLTVGKCLDIRYEGKVHIISQIHGVDGSILFPGMTVARRKVFILPYSGHDGRTELLSPVRRAVVHQFLLEQYNAAPLLVGNYAPHVSVYDFRSDTNRTIAIANHSLDEVSGIELIGADLNSDNWVWFSRHTPEGLKLALTGEENRTTVEGTIPPLSMVVLHRELDV